LFKLQLKMSGVFFMRHSVYSRRGLTSAVKAASSVALSATLATCLNGFNVLVV